MKKVLLLIASLLVASCAHMPRTASQLNNYYQSAVIVRVKTTNVEDGVTTIVGWSGTGFSLASTDSGDEPGSTILTNKHVCSAADNATYTLTDYTGKRYQAKFVRYAPQADLCILKTDAMIKPVTLAKHDARRGDHLTVVGAPRGEFPNFTEGWVSGYCPVDLAAGGIEVHVRALCTSIPIYPGNSGSPAFGDDGKVYGIMFAGRSDSEHMTSMVPVEVILQFLDTSNDMFFR